MERKWLIASFWCKNFLTFNSIKLRIKNSYCDISSNPSMVSQIMWMAPYRQQRNYHSAEFIFLTFVFINFWPTKLMKYLDKLNLICWIDIDSRQFFPLPSYLKKTFLLQKRSKVILKKFSCYDYQGSEWIFVTCVSLINAIQILL